MIELVPLFLLVLYLVPFMIAAGRNHDSMVFILMVNLVLGWTVIGWIAVFFWALLSSVDPISAPRNSSRGGGLGLPEARRVKGPMIVRVKRSDC